MLKDSNFNQSIFNLKTLSPFERLLFVFLLATLFISAYISLYKVSMHFSSNEALHGGEWKEGVASPASDIFNPILSNVALDLDINSLVYSGLLRASKNGYEPDLAESYEISEDGKEYSFKLRDNVYFHDGKKLSSTDVAFTISSIQNPLSNSPLRAAWEGVRVEVIDDKNLKIILPKAYAPFIENLTVGIMPEHLWSSFSAQDMPLSIYNKKPVGSGPYKFIGIQEIPNTGLRIYHLQANKDFYLGEPYIKDLYIYKYPNKADLLLAWSEGKLDAISSLPAELADKYKNKNSRIIEKNYLREFAVFFNSQKKPALLNKKVRHALDLAIDKNKLVKQVLHSYASALENTLPSYFINTKKTDIITEKDRKEKIDKLMSDAGWKKNDSGIWEKKGKEFKLQLSIADSNDEIERVANFLQDEFKNYGFKLTFKKYDLATLNNKVIRERNFEALLFGIELGRVPDLYQFWHSSQKDDPGLNISKYHNKKVDKILEKLQTTNDAKKRKELLIEFNKLIEEDKPAIFLFSPKYLYLSKKDLKGMEISPIVRPHERFADVFKWFKNSQTVWTFFIRNIN